MDNKTLLRQTHVMLEKAAINVVHVLNTNMDRVHKLDELIAIQTTEGTWNYDEYQFGMANGLICARAALTGEEPKYLSAPKSWRKDGQVGQTQRFEGDRAHGTNGSREGRVAEDNAKTIRRN